jgi:hypothetical protein
VEGTELEAVPGYFLHGMVKLPLQFRPAERMRGPRTAVRLPHRGQG